MKTPNTKINQIQNLHNSMDSVQLDLGVEVAAVKLHGQVHTYHCFFCWLVGFVSQGFPEGMEPVLELAL